MKRRNIKVVLAVITICLLAVTTAACAGQEKDTAGTGEETGTVKEESSGEGKESSDTLLGEFETETLYGEKADQSVFTGADLTMVNIWGTFCGPCIKEMPELGELGRQYADKGVQIVGIISDVNQAENEDAVEIVEATKADFTHLILSDSLRGPIHQLAQAVPTTMFLDKEGRQVGSTYPGARSKEQWALIVDQMLEEVK